MAHVSRRKKVFIISGVVLLLAAGATFFFWPQITATFNGWFSPVAVNEVERDATSVVRAESQKLFNTALQAAAESGAEAGQAVLNDGLAAAETSVEKSVIYAQKAALAGSGATPNNSEALQFAYEAEKIAPDYATAILIASLEESLGNIEKAVEYYKLYLERLTPTAIELNPGDKDAYTKKVEQLEAQL